MAWSPADTPPNERDDRVTNDLTPSGPETNSSSNQQRARPGSAVPTSPYLDVYTRGSRPETAPPFARVAEDKGPSNRKPTLKYATCVYQEWA